MTLFKRVEAATAEMERIVGELSGPCEQAEENKRKLDKLQSMAGEVSPSIVRLRKAGEETDPAKKTYGEQMAQKVLALCDRYDALEPRINEVREKVTAAYEVVREEMAKKEAEEKAAAEKAAAEKAASDAKAKEASDAAAKKEQETKAAAAAAAEAAMREKKAAADNAAAEAKKASDAKAAQEAAEAQANAKEEESKAAASEKDAANAGAASGEGIKLNIKSNVSGEGSKTVEIGELDMTVLKLQEEIERQLTVPVAQQRLIFSGRVLDKSKKLTEYGVKAGCSLHMVVSAAIGGGSATPSSKASPGAASSSSPAAGQSSPGIAGAGAGGGSIETGKVHEVREGSVELKRILTQAGGRLVVVDWFAPWCGPCRNIKPLFEAFASKYNDVVFVSVDSEATGENKALMMDASIRAFPTFHFYLNAVRVHEFSGADPGKLESAIVRHKANATPAPGAGGSPAARSSQGADEQASNDLVAKVKSALVRVKAGAASDFDFLQSCRTLLQFIGNCVTHPDEVKYRKIRRGNNTFQQRLGGKAGGIDALLAFGFREVSEGMPPEDYFVLEEVTPEMVRVKELLEAAVPGGAAVASQPVSSSPAASAGGGVGGLFGAGGALSGGVPPGVEGMLGASPEAAMRMMNNPAMRTMATRMMSNPRLMQQMQESMASGNPQAMMQSPDFQNMMQEMMSDPEFARAMMDPEMMSQMMSMGGGMGGMGGMGGGMPPGGLAAMLGGLGGGGASPFAGFGGAGATPATGGGASPFAGFGGADATPATATTPAAPSTAATPSAAAPAPAPASAPASGADEEEADDAEEEMLRQALQMSMEQSGKNNASGDGAGSK